MATKASGFTFQGLTSPLVGARPCSGARWPWAVCLLLSGAGPPGLLRGRWRSAAVRLPSSGVVLGFRKRANRWPLVGSRFVTVSKHKRSFSLNRLVAQVSSKNWTYGQSASLHSAITKQTICLAW